MTIFVSHSSSDAEAVRSLVQSLEAAGGRVWLDQDLNRRRGVVDGDPPADS
ncbi:MAG TPA: TIR domain-containing protein [Micropruina sp.]|nr:TIR domain-containing protein [Micropruina sp.]